MTYLRIVKLKICAGMLPLNEFLDKSNNWSMVQFVNNSGGMTPLRLFPLNLKASICCILAKHGGMLPCN